jgi:SAM-dependent methyltransferase
VALDVDQFKQGQRRMWSSGDYPEIATRIESAAEALVGRGDVRPGQDVLDVATGSGNAALVAARAGANVTGLDLTPELFEAARRRAVEAGVEIEWIEGDAEALPFPDDSFDRVFSVFGTMFAPRHEQAASEMVRVCRPGGAVGVCAWTPAGVNGAMFKTVAQHIPPPEGAKPPSLWGSEDYVRDSLFGPSGAEIQFEHGAVPFVADSVEEWLDYNERVLGPWVMAKAALEREGKWEPLRADLAAIYERANQATDGTMRVDADYLIAIATLPE